MIRYTDRDCPPKSDLTIGTLALGLCIGLVGWYVIFLYFGVI